MVESTMNSEHPNKQSIPADKPSQALSIPRWAVFVAALLVLLPILLMTSMIVMMGLFGPPMHGGIVASSSGLFAVVGVILLLLVPGVIYGTYRLYAADRE